jgi:hypothetical protein
MGEERERRKRDFSHTNMWVLDKKKEGYQWFKPF